MILILISIKDRAIQAFQPPFAVRAKGEAMRNFMDAVNDPNNKQLHAHPEDYELYIVGYFDDNTGQITTIDPTLLTVGNELQTPRS